MLLIPLYIIAPMTVEDHVPYTCTV